ncbi:hypothetical protein GIS00_03145 [Nakamurella sp. YIM 132087]|uniref:YcxB family protein n=1 Tax=Nakamurella alba TaxID=2665158 RepID=A0A7K1FFU5_9ACTN|nr:hypothetical protein [Nakamurella alba]MTD12940.1 hypothetical protein [Nakamurella alba]
MAGGTNVVIADEGTGRRMADGFAVVRLLQPLNVIVVPVAAGLIGFGLGSGVLDRILIGLVVAVLLVLLLGAQGRAAVRSRFPAGSEHSLRLGKSAVVLGDVDGSREIPYTAIRNCWARAGVLVLQRRDVRAAHVIPLDTLAPADLTRLQRLVKG